LNERLERIFESPAQIKLGILFGSIVALFAAFYLLYYSEVSDSIDQLSAKLEGPKGLRAQIIEKEGIARNLDLYEKEVEMLDVQLKLALRELPDKREIYLFLDSISDKARNAGLDVPLFQPQPELKRDFYAEVPVQISVRGTFHQVATFFDEVGHLERIVNIDRFQMGQPWQEKERIQLTTNLTATTFRFLDESERPKIEEKQTGKTKRRGARPPKTGS
jgi:type IV pilus assembly protein PilO